MTRCDLHPWEPFLKAGTSHQEQGRGVRLVPQPGERVSVFAADTPDFRAHFGNEQSCDFIFLVEGSGARKLFFIELKGRRFEDAVEQLVNTFRAVRSKLPRDCRDSTELAAVAITAGGTPSQEARKAVERFQKMTGKRLERRSLPKGSSLDLRPLI